MQDLMLGIRRSVTAKIGIIVGGCLLLILGGVFIALLNRSSNRELALAERNTREIKDILIKSTLFSMNEGVTDVTPLINMLKQIPNMQEVRIIPADAIEAGSEDRMDATENRVFNTGQSYFNSEDFLREPVIRSVEPIIAAESCLKCHSGQPGEALAVLSIRYSIKDTMDSIGHQRQLAVFCGIITILLACFLIAWMIHREILRDLKNLVKFINHISMGKIDNNVETERVDEVGEAFHSLSVLQNNLVAKTEVARKISEGNLEFNTQTVSGYDVLGQAMDTMSGTLKQVIMSIKSVHEKQKAGDYDAGIPEEDFKGAFREVAIGVNDVIKMHVDNILMILDIANAYSEGDFSRTLKRLPGKQAVLNEIIDRLRDNLVNLTGEVTQLTAAAVQGQLRERGETSGLKGEFLQLMTGINKTLDAIVGPVEEGIDVLESVAEGNLTRQMKGEYAGEYFRMKEALNGSVDSLNGILKHVSISVEEVASGARQMSESSQTVSRGATEQAGTLQEITSSMTEINSRTRQNAESANRANDLTSMMRSAAAESDDHMNQMLDAMTEVNNASDEISKIIRVIDEIAFQTNLLALNAAVEAARAGVHGKGFAVVAEEVRNLAHRSARAAHETAELIENSIEKSHKGKITAQQTAQALRKIIDNVEKVSEITNEIAGASSDQLTGIEQINQALSQIDHITQSTAANAEESASASQELSGRTVQLKHMLSRFQLHIAGEPVGIPA